MARLGCASPPPPPLQAQGSLRAILTRFVRPCCVGTWPLLGCVAGIKTEYRPGRVSLFLPINTGIKLLFLALGLLARTRRESRRGSEGES